MLENYVIYHGTLAAVNARQKSASGINHIWSDATNSNFIQSSIALGICCSFFLPTRMCVDVQTAALQSKRKSY